MANEGGMVMSTFYYDNQKLQKLVLFNAVLLSLVIFAGNICPEHMGFISSIAVLCLISFSASLYVVVFPQRLALIDEEGIKIDHNAKLKWEEIAKAEHKKVKGCMNREIITLSVKDGVKYRRRFMQHLSKHSPYGEFSIPLYAMTEEDKKAVVQELSKYIKIAD